MRSPSTAPVRTLPTGSGGLIADLRADRTDVSLRHGLFADAVFRDAHHLGRGASGMWPLSDKNRKRFPAPPWCMAIRAR